MKSRGAALMEIVIVLPLLILLGGAISYFGYCQLLNTELNLLAWEGASYLARGQTIEHWERSLEGRRLLADPSRITAKLKGGALFLSYPLPAPLWAKEDGSREISFTWQRPPRK